MICRWCGRDNGKVGQSVEARVCPECKRYGPDESMTDAIAWCDHCGHTHTGPKPFARIAARNCGAQPRQMWEEAGKLWEQSQQ